MTHTPGWLKIKGHQQQGWRGCGAPRSPGCCGRHSKTVQPLRKTIWQHPLKPNWPLCYDPETPLLGLAPPPEIYKNIHSSFVHSNHTWKLKCPPKGGWILKSVYSHCEQKTAKKKKTETELLPHTVSWLKPRDIWPKEARHKRTHIVWSHVYKVQQNKSAAMEIRTGRGSGPGRNMRAFWRAERTLYLDISFIACRNSSVTLYYVKFSTYVKSNLISVKFTHVKS